LILGNNLLIYYETREQWEKYPPGKYHWQPAKSRISPLEGEYVARIPDTTRDNDKQIREGYTNKQTGGQGAGIRFYEYASSSEIEATKYQLAFISWRTKGITKMAKKEGIINPQENKRIIDKKCQEMGLANIDIRSYALTKIT
jgi:hypothetical protein